MKLGNGYGSITKMSGNRRKKWRVRLPYSEADRLEGKKRVTLGYFSTKAEALQALAEYHKDPEIYLNRETTFMDVYNLWKVTHYKNLNHQTINGYENAYKKCVLIQNMPINEIKLHHLQTIIDNAPGNYRIKENIRLLMNQVFNYAILNDMVKKSYVKGVEIGAREPVHKKEIFTEEDIKLLWNNINDIYIVYLLVLIYSGMRLNELYNMKCENIHLDENYMVGGSKTKAGKNRVIPIHARIKPIIQNWYNPQNELLINTGRSWQSLSKYIIVATKKLGLGHKTAHEARHTFITRMHEVGVPLSTTQLIVGHAQKTVTEKIYTHTSIKELVDAVNKLP